MKPEIKKLWVEALRSGKYKQGQYRLRIGDEFCCLGVLCDLSGLDYVHSHGALPAEVKEWAGIKDSLAVPIDGKYEFLYRVNDHMPGYNFKRIADLIEVYL